jgi:hypothetical protein
MCNLTIYFGGKGELGKQILWLLLLVQQQLQQ